MVEQRFGTSVIRIVAFFCSLHPLLDAIRSIISGGSNPALKLRHTTLELLIHAETLVLYGLAALLTHRYILGCTVTHHHRGFPHVPLRFRSFNVKHFQAVAQRQAGLVMTW